MFSTFPIFRWPIWHTLWRGTAYVLGSFLSIFRPLVARLAPPPSLVDVEKLVSTEEESQKACLKPTLCFQSNSRALQCPTSVPTGDGESVKPRIMPVTYVSVPGKWIREARPDLPPEFFEPRPPQPGEVMYVSKGYSLAIGGTALIERLPSGNIVKTPKPHPILYKKYFYEMRLEASIYEKIGSHRSIPRIIDWDPETCCLTMEYMQNGNLRDYVRENHDNITLDRRYQWARQSAEGLSAVHSAGAIHCDISPRNFLLDDDLNLKISDFGGGSLSGSKPTAIYSTRFLPPGYDEDKHPAFKDDIFSLGSVIYFIMTGKYPYEDTPSDEVDKLYGSHTFPDIAHLSCRAIIQQCWEMQIDTAQDLYHAVETLERAQIPNPL
jgi:serine/threonine protein kinase